MSATSGARYDTPQTGYLVRKMTKDDLSGTYSLGWLPKNAAVIAVGAHVLTAWNGTGDEAVDIGFRNAQHTADPNAFTATAIDIDAGIGHTRIVDTTRNAANLPFTTQGAEITATIVNTDATAGELYVYVEFVNFDHYEPVAG